MRTYTLLACISALLVLSACSEEYRLERKEDKLLGTWEFEKAFYKADNALFRDNITGEYMDDIMEFYGDYTAMYYDYSANIEYPGEWQILTDRDYYYDSEGGGGDLEFFIDAVFWDVLPEGDFAFFGSIDRLNEDRLVFEARDRRGTYTFKLCRR
jgi:hypothetical protein